jgi:hypothetical protein
MNQVTNGIAVRMAVLYLLANRPKVALEHGNQAAVAQEPAAPRRLRRRAG